MANPSQLYLDLVAWLKDVSSLDELIEYAKKIPEDEATRNVFDVYIRDLCLEDAQAIINNLDKAFPGIVNTCSLNDMLLILTRLHKNNSQSVLAWIKKDYGLDCRYGVKELRVWVEQQFIYHNKLMFLGSVFDYLKQSFYIEPLVKLIQRMGPDRVINTLQELMIIDSERPLVIDKVESNVASEISQRLLVFEFLPKDEVLILSQPDSRIARTELCVILLRISNLIRSYLSKRKDPNNSLSSLSDSLWLWLRDQYEYGYVAVFETLIINMTVDGKKLMPIYEWFSKLWIKSNILSGQAVNKTAEYIDSANPDQVEVIKSIIESVILNNNSINYLINREYLRELILWSETGGDDQSLIKEVGLSIESSDSEGFTDEDKNYCYQYVKILQPLVKKYNLFAE